MGLQAQVQAEEAVVLPGAASGRRITSDADGQIQSIRRKIMPIPHSRDTCFLSIFVICVTMSLSLRLLRPAVRAPCRVTKTWCWKGYATVEVPASRLNFGQPLHETHPHLLKPGESATTYICLTRVIAKQRSSHTQHYCPRILYSSPKARRTPSAKFDRHTRWLRPEVCFRRSLLQVPPGPRLPVPDRYIHCMTQQCKVVTDEPRFQGTRRACNHREARRR